MKANNWKPPATGPKREHLRKKGQFWTPDWIAEAMVAYVAQSGSTIFDPAVGAGAFFKAAKIIGRETGAIPTLLGTELDPAVLEQTVQNGLSAQDLAEVQIRDFVLDPPQGPFRAIVGNPPYIRHHRLSRAVKAKLRELSLGLVGTALDGRAGFHVYFLLRALELLERHGRLAFIMPADTCEGVFADTLWQWITREFRLEAVVTFAPEASPFPGVDTNPIIFMLRNAKPLSHIIWARCLAPHADELKTWVAAGLPTQSTATLSVCRRELGEAVETGLSKVPSERLTGGPTLGDFAKVMRGIATGANEFFFLTASRADALCIPREFLLPALGRTRDVPGDMIDQALMKSIERKGRPTLLFSPDGRELERFPPAVRKYLRHGARLGIDKRSLIRTRRPWYKMERRARSPILFSYLGRRNARFIRNMAGVTPLTGFLCVYPKKTGASFVDKLWLLLNNPETLANLPSVGKSYGAGAIKVEPRNLERLPLPISLIAHLKLKFPPRYRQLTIPLPKIMLGS